MPPRRPPPLPKSLFVPNGPLAPGSAPLPPEPTSLHPEYIIDAHSFPTSVTHSPDPLYDGLPDSYPRPPVRSAVQVKLNVSAEPASAVLGVKPFSIHPTVLNLTLATPPSITNIAKGAVDIIVPCVAPLTEKEWDLLDEAVNALDGSWGSVSPNKDGMDVDPSPAAGTSPGKICISGLLPPPLTKTSEPLLRDEAYNLHVARLAQLSLHANVYLKALPPVVDLKAQKKEGEKWWEDRTEVLRAIKMYAAPAIETFGTHRIIFGSSPTLPLADLAMATLSETELVCPIPSGEWYASWRRCVTELGEGQEAVSGVCGGNAAKVYELS